MNTFTIIIASTYLLIFIVIFTVVLPLALEVINIEIRMRRFQKDVLAMFPTRITDENIRILAKKRFLREGQVLRSLNVLIAEILTEQNIDEKSNSPEAVALSTLKKIRQAHEHDLPMKGVPASLRFYVMKVREAMPNKSEEFIAPLVEQLVEFQAIERRKRFWAIVFGGSTFLLGVIGVDWTRVTSWFHNIS